MSKFGTVKGVLKVTLSSMLEDFRQMDHKLLRLGVMAATFIIWALFWFYFFRGSSPFGF